jgi:hypothetical protein
MNSFEDDYYSVLNNMGGILGTREAAQYAEGVQSSLDNAIEMLRREATHRANVPEDYLKGWLAEQWHAGTLNVSAAARGRSDVSATVLGDNGPGDVRYGDATSTHEAQVKYYKTSEDTAKAISRPEYQELNKVGPSDQMEDIKNAAAHLAHKNQMNRPEQAANYQDTADRVTDRLEVGNASSRPLAETQAKEMARDFRKDGDIDPDKYGLDTQSFVEWSDVARESSQAALEAALMSAAFSAAPHIWAVLKNLRENGEIDPNDLLERGQAVLLGPGTAGLRGGVAASLTAACKTGLLGQALTGISPTAIGMATTMTLNVMNYSIQLSQGRINNREFAHHCLRDTFVLSTGMLGAVVGQMLIPIPVLGGLAGSLVGVTVGLTATVGANQIFMGICREYGWTFFGVVGQDYGASEEVLREVGYDLFCTRFFVTHPLLTRELKTRELRTRELRTKELTTRLFRAEHLNFIPMRRGLIACNVAEHTEM